MGRVSTRGLLLKFLRQSILTKTDFANVRGIKDCHIEVEINGNQIAVYNESINEFNINIRASVLIKMLEAAGDYKKIIYGDGTLVIGNSKNNCISPMEPSMSTALRHGKAKTICVFHGDKALRLFQAANFFHAGRGRNLLRFMKLSSTEKNKIMLRCTDGRTLANDIVSGAVSEDFELAIRADEVIKLGRVIGKPRMISIIESNGTHYINSTGLNHTILWNAGVREDTNYPDTDKAIPNRDDCTHVIGINRKLFLAHANNVRKMNERGDDRMDLSFNAVNAITVKSSSHDIDYSGILVCSYGLHDRLPFRISLNASYVKRILSTYKPDVIRLEYYAPNMPVIFDMADKTDNESGGQRVLLMPLRAN